MIDLDGKEFTIPANSNRSFPVAVTVGKSVVPGEYEIGVSADPITPAMTGIAVLGAAQLRTKLSVFGEAGSVRINAVAPEGEPFNDGEINLFEKAGTGLTSVGYATEILRKLGQARNSPFLLVFNFLLLILKQF